ncbi:hypothetical protein CDV36_015486 [Fusarium kuroshium]|uniref:Uncharacterized protein n=1 Tax=Fusarium kuroshium TaxID=2010991 RepID=A0A3M2RAE3_9HYPO|nr:hypothetical protein CDV36_015486 [Fusarium kuroshium]
MAKELRKAESPASGDVEFREGTREGVLSGSNTSSDVEEAFERDLNVTEDDLLEAKEVAATLSLQDVRKVRSLHHALSGQLYSQLR